MHDVPVLEAIDAALRRPTFCSCGEYLTVAVHDGAAWLECPAFARPSRLPSRVAAIAHELLHDRSLIIEIPVPRRRRAARTPARVLEPAGRTG